ncbi:MAG: hypothetical protein M1839_004053 [Geoglossum umbratile]|nr:MAG: hypothetical protein M1839_004053 [Geoglossum umbratile]
MNGPEQRSRSQASGSGGLGNDTRPRVYSGSGISRAQRFDDEKRRIIECCFSKRDAAGSLLESYITHVRITEDAAYPLSPPPPSSPPENKKPRVIVVTVRKSGRVRMHKARENVNGSFSIGKTWHLDDLTAIESFTGGGREGEEGRTWAGGSGFTVTLLKPYFWMAGSQKEKEFFIASLTKIYRKYTGGRLPQLIGFDPKEMEQLLGSQGQPNRAGIPLIGEEKSPLAQQRLPVVGPPGSAGQRSLGGESTEDARTPLSSPELKKLPSGGGGGGGSSGSRERDAYETPPGGRLGGGDYLPSPGKPDTPPLNGARVATPLPEPEPPKSQPTPPIEVSATPSPPPTSAAAPLKEDEKFRPGLGPMIKKKPNVEVANTFRRAATAYNAFKPRAGGAGDAPPDQVDGQAGEPDGINGVVPAPALLRGRTQDLGKSTTLEQPASKKPVDDVPDVKVTSPTDRPQVVTEPLPTAIKPQTQAPEKALPKIVKSQVKLPEAHRQPPRSYLTARHFAAIDVDPSLLEARTVEIEPILSEFGWGGAKVHELKVEAIEAGLKREIGGVEAGSWLDHLEQKDERVEAVERMLDRAIAECDELEGLLALYGVELSSLNEDIAFIEAQSEGLQVQVANQKLLKAEVQGLLKGNRDTPQPI